MLMHEPLYSINSSNLASSQECPPLCISVITRDSNDPVIGEEIFLIRSRVFSTLGSHNVTHMLDKHTSDSFNGKINIIIVKIYPDPNGVWSSRRMLHGNALKGKSLHFLLGARRVERKSNETLHLRNGVTVVGACGYLRRFTDTTRLFKSHHGRVETVGVSIENDIYSSPSSSSNNCILASKIKADDAHLKIWLIVLVTGR
mmetsp:Transcript_5703/g.10807  ORF Transcript_5703/g.10807 Transcript_5703/m.10807 type:complete len:201 (-) Transcript_5703:151-753(-)